MMSRHHLFDEDLESNVPLLTDHEHHVQRDTALSPAMSTISNQSQEVKYIFEPCASQVEREADINADYSHIHIRPKHRASNGTISGRPPPYNRYENNPVARCNYTFQPGFVSGGVQRFRSQPQTVSLEDVSGCDPTRRKSWSPPLMGQNVQGYQAEPKNIRSCYSSNNVDWETSQQGMGALNLQNCSQGHPQGHAQGYPQTYLQGHLQINLNSTETESLPPRLAPVSGVLSEKLSRNIIRPIAFKPAHPRACSSVCHQCGGENASCGCPSFLASRTQTHHPGPDPYQSWSPRSPSVRSVSSVNTSQLSVHSGGENSNRYSADDSPPGVSVDHSPSRKPSAVGSDVLAQTPSPSDSGVGELEAMLKEREAEILTLRQVMDRNERAIFQVYEEKKSRWLQEMREIKEEYEHKLKVQQQKANKLEQALSLQIRRLQHEKQQIQGKFSCLQAEKDAAVRYSLNQTEMNISDTEGPGSSTLSPVQRKVSSSSLQSSSGDPSQEPAVQEELAMKNTEILALRSQMHLLEEKQQHLSEIQDQVSLRTQELKLVRAQLDDLSRAGKVSVCEECTQTFATDFENEFARPAVISDEEYTLSLERQIDTLREQLQAAEVLVETERMQWLEEKNKVIRYQKQLQLNYVQMQRKNTVLEADVEQLTLELESRDLKLVALNGEESVC